MAGVSDSGALLFDEAFDQFCGRAELPDFDFICLHGIWSWISDENRAIIVEFIRKKLKVGGVLYISYNTQPGWAAMLPMRDLLTEHAEVMGSKGSGIVSRIDGALSFVDKLISVNPTFVKANPHVVDRVKSIKDKDRHYVAHEYFNRDWKPMGFSKMAEWLQPAKVEWACSASYTDAVDAVNLTTDQQELLRDIPDPMLRQSVRDFCVNQLFRKDYWVKGARKLSGLEQSEVLRQQRIVLIQPRQDISLKINTSLGEVSLKEDVYDPILDILADYKPRTIGQLEQELNASTKGEKINANQLMQAILILSGCGVLLPAQDSKLVQKLKSQTDALNLDLMRRARSTGEISFLASPVTGGGVAVGRFHQLFLLARSLGHKQPTDWALFAWNILDIQGQRLVKDGQSLSSAETNTSELKIQAESFAVKELLLLKALEIA